MKGRIQYFFITLLLLGSAIVLARNAWAEEEAITFSKNDRVLILAPHPDDEAIATGGSIQKALEGATTLDEVLRVTVGDQDLDTV